MLLTKFAFAMLQVGRRLGWNAIKTVAGLVILASMTSGALAQQTAANDPSLRGIAVTGIGEVSVKPNVAEVDIRSQATAELTNDAIVKYKESRRRTMEAFQKLKIPELTVTEQGINIGNNSGSDPYNPWGGRQVQNQKQSIMVSRGFKVRIKGIDKMPDDKVLETVGKIFDTAKDSGTPIGPSMDEINNAWRYGRAPRPGMARFYLEDFAEHREAAYQKAIDDARKRAERLAKLHNLSLGKVSGIRETFVAGDEAANIRQNPYYYDGQTSEMDDVGSRIEASSFSNIRLRVKVAVQFEIVNKDGKAQSP